MDRVNAIASHRIECSGAINHELEANADPLNSEDARDSQKYQLAKKASGGNNSFTQAVVTVGEDFSQRVSCNYFRASNGACMKLPDSRPCVHYRVIESKTG